jgi:hypothetical protein
MMQGEWSSWEKNGERDILYERKVNFNARFGALSLDSRDGNVT